MSDFLDTMQIGSTQRWQAARRVEPLAALRRRALATPPPPPLRLRTFDLIAEVKLAAPSAGRLARPPANPEAYAAARALDYAKGGAAAISVLTEPSRFSGALSHLQAAARAVSVPVMRKDFLVNPYQLWEARAVGAGGALLIVRMLDDAVLRDMLDHARAAGLFVLLEAFDRADLDRIAALPPVDQTLVGVNTRDLATLEVVPNRLRDLLPHVPSPYPAVAESGLTGPDDVAIASHAGWDLALVGTALMRSGHPRDAAREMIRRGRGARR